MSDNWAIFTFVAWLILGGLILLFGDPNKLQYFICWICLMGHLFHRMVVEK